MNNNNFGGTFINTEIKQKTKAWISIFGFFGILTIILLFLANKLDGNKVEEAKLEDIDITTLADVESFDPLKNAAKDDDGDGITNWREFIGGEFSSSTVKQDISEDNVKYDYTSNFTQIIGRDLYVSSRYASNNENISTESISNALMENLKTIFNPPKISSLSLSNSLTQTQIKDYLNQVATLLIFLDSNNGEEWLELENSINNNKTDFKNTISYMSKVNVACEMYSNIKNIPYELDKNHTELIFHCQKYVMIMDAFVGNQTDPVKAQVAMSVYEENKLALKILYESYKNYTTKNNISFQSNELGKIFNK